MSSDQDKQLESRAVCAAENALADHAYVSAIDVFMGMGLLAQAHVTAWRQGRVPFLEQVIQGSPNKVLRCMEVFRAWAAARGLQPSETYYGRHTRGGSETLRFSESADPAVEAAYRTHFVSPVLSEAKRRRLKERLDQPPERVVFWTLRDSRCAECGIDLGAGSFLAMEAEQPLCLACAGLAELEFLEAGDAALTRRAKKYSRHSAVVVRFSRSRGRYERQGILVEESALRKAEEECTQDAGDRARDRARSRQAREKEDRKLVEEMARRIRELFPGCPPAEASAIAAHTAVRGSGRVGRSAAGRELAGEALLLAVTAAIRHRHTGYDELLLQGADRTLARERVRDRVEEILRRWQRG